MTDTLVREVASMADVFLATAERRGGDPALLNADQTVALSWREYGAQARSVATGLIELGVRPGDTLGLLLTNRHEFHVADAAALLLGATPFSMYNTSAPEQLEHLLSDAGCRVVLTEASLAPRLLPAVERTGQINDVVVIDDGASWAELLAHPEIAERHPGADGDALATLIYTSGTTGPPKGVQLTHGNVVTMAQSVATLLRARPDQRAISYLPMAHIAERTATHYLPMVAGISVVCVPDHNLVTQLLPQVRPHIFFSPPRLWEKFQAAVEGAAAGGANAEDIRRGLGFDRLEAAITGAAPCPRGVHEFFASIGIFLREAYGLSETTGLVSLASPDDIRLGTVGPPLEGTEVRLLEDGELLVRGPLNMAGYRNRPEATAEMIDADGWLHSGDIAQFDDAGHLVIVDRKKELIINAAGKNMSPANIEARLKEGSPLIGQACVIGDARPYNVALIVLDPVVAARFGDGEPRAEVAQGVERANARLSRVEQIKRYTILAGDWLPDSEELTPTMKLKRRVIAKKYAVEIEALYTAVVKGAKPAGAAVEIVINVEAGQVRAGDAPSGETA
jgi:long-chain acyl-CoA synthetase